MSVDRFYPYRTAAERVILDLSPPEELNLRRTGDGSIVVYEEGPEELMLHASVCVADDVLEQVVPTFERGTPPVDVRLVCSSRESRRRMSFPLPGDGIHEGELTLLRREWRGAVDIRAVLTRTSAAPDPEPGYASDYGALLAWSGSRRVLFDEPPQPPGDQLEVRWENFAESASAWRRRHANSIFALETGGERPVVLLNSGIPRAFEFLGSAGTHGKKARVRDATNYMIAHQVWTSLVAISLTSVSAVDIESEELNPEDILGEVEDWQARILRDWSRHLYPGTDPEAALQAMIKAAGNPTDTQILLSTLPNAIQERFHTFRGFQGLVQEGDVL